MTEQPRSWLLAFAAALILFEATLTTLIVYKIPYTEIDWIAYMQEVTVGIESEEEQQTCQWSRCLPPSHQILHTGGGGLLLGRRCACRRRARLLAPPGRYRPARLPSRFRVRHHLLESRSYPLVYLLSFFQDMS